MSIQSGQTLDRDTLNRAYVSKSATGTQIMAGSLRLLGSKTIDGTLTAGATTVSSLTVTGSLSAGANSITTTGTITAGTFSGSGASLTSLPVNQFGVNRISSTNLPTNVFYTDTVQTITANTTFSSAANVYFAGGTTYYVQTTGNAKFNTLTAAGATTLSSTLAVTSTSTFTGAITANSNLTVAGIATLNGNMVFGNASTDTIAVNGTPTFNTDVVMVKNLEVQGEFKAGINNEFPDSLLASGGLGKWGGSKSGTVTLEYDPVQAPNATGAIGSIKLTATGADAWVYYDYKFDVQPNEWMTFSTHCFCTTASKSTQIYFEFTKADGTTTATGTYPSVTFIAPTAWTRYSLTAQAPVDAAKLRIRIDNDGGSGAVMYFSAFQLERGRTMTGFKPYQGGKDLSLSHDGTTSLLYSLYPLTINKSISVLGEITLTGAIRYEGDLSFLTSGGSAIRLLTGGLLVSNTYADNSKVPTNGMWVKGDIATTGNIDMSGRAEALIYMGNVSAGSFGLAYSAANKDYGLFYKEGSPDKVTLSPDGGGPDGTAFVVNGNKQVGIGTNSPTSNIHVVGTGNITGNTTIGGTLTAAGLVISSSVLTHNTADSFDKIRLYNSAAYTIGFKSGLSYGYITNNYAMTFTMNNDVNRGFLWRDEADAVSDGAMSLTTDGRLYVKAVVDGATLNIRSTANIIGNTTIGGTLAVTGIATVDNLNVTSGNGEGVRFWASSSYSVYMSTTADGTFGGAVSSAATSDYNMYFRMQGGGTNRGFVFNTADGNVVQIEKNGKVHSEAGFRTKKYEMVYNATEESLDFVFMS